MFTSVEIPRKTLSKILSKINVKKLMLCYNKAKIKNSPVDFKLGKRIITYGDFEYNLYLPPFEIADVVISKGKIYATSRELSKDISIDTYSEILRDEARESMDKMNEVFPSCFANSENLNLFVDLALAYCLNYFKKDKPCRTADFDIPNIVRKVEYMYKKFANTLEFLTTPKSVCTELCMNNYRFTDNSFEDLRELTDVKKDLEHKRFRYIPRNNASIWVPLDRTPVVSLSKPTEKKSHIEELHTSYKAFMKVAVKRAYELALEIMYYLYNYEEGIFDEIFSASSKTFQKLVLDAQKAGILFEESPKERYYKIIDFISAYKFSDNLNVLYKENNLYVSLMLHNLVAYAQNFAVFNFYTKASLILIDYAKENGIKIREELEASDLPIGFSGTVKDEEDKDEDKSPSEYSPDSDEYKPAKYCPMKYSSLAKATLESSGKKKPEILDPAILDMAAAKFSADRYHFDIESRYTKSVSPSIINEYNRIAVGCKMISNNLTKQIRNIKCYNFGGKNSGKLAGKLDNKRLYLYKTQKDIFCDNTYKVKEMDPVFGIILDQSGSMCGSGIKNGRVTMILLHEVLKSLGVNHSIIGHTSLGDYQSTIFKYVAFKEDKGYTLNKAYNLADMEALNGNCDSGALYYMEQQLLRTKQKDKICIVFSDGAPTECTGTDLREQVSKMENEGIRVIGVGVDFESIKAYYPNNANGKNLKEMIDIVCDLLKRFVLEKED